MATVGPIGILASGAPLKEVPAGFLSGLGFTYQPDCTASPQPSVLPPCRPFFLEWNGPLGPAEVSFWYFRTSGSLDRSSLPRKAAGTPGIYETSSPPFAHPHESHDYPELLGLFTSLGPVVSPRILVAGVFSGSAFWWLILCGTADRLGTMLSPSSLVWIRRGSGILLLSFALSLLFL